MKYPLLTSRRQFFAAVAALVRLKGRKPTVLTWQPSCPKPQVAAKSAPGMEGGLAVNHPSNNPVVQLRDFIQDSAKLDDATWDEAQRICDEHVASFRLGHQSPCISLAPTHLRPTA